MNPKCTESVHKVYEMWTQSKHKVYLNLQVYTKCTESVQKAYGSIHKVTFSIDTEFGSFSEHISLQLSFQLSCLTKYFPETSFFWSF